MNKNKFLLGGTLLFDIKLTFSKIALIFGITGQDGQYLSEFLKEKKYEVYGVSSNIDSCINKTIYHCNIKDNNKVLQLIKNVSPDEIYNLAGQTSVAKSFSEPQETISVNLIGTINILEAIRIVNPKIKFFQANSSEILDNSTSQNLDENTKFHITSPYAISKLAAYFFVKNYKDAYKIFACSGILFNHESPKRNKNFVSKKIARKVAKIKMGSNKTLKLGNIDSTRDWGFAKDYVEAMWLILQQDKPNDYIIASGKTHTVREFVELAFKEIGIEIMWYGSGLEEKGIDKQTGKIMIEIDPKFFRPIDKTYKPGNFKKLQEVTGWYPKTSFNELVKIMIDKELNYLKRLSLE
jgi:GDPmannose 4,6-dehydratase